MYRKKLAIIGGGGAGSVAAWALHKIHDVKLYESESFIGGHASTYKINIEDQMVAVDLGVEYFSEKQAPNLCALLKHFNIETFVAPLSFTFGCNVEAEFWSNYNIKGELNRKLEEEFAKFHFQMHEVMHLYSSEIKMMSLGQFLKQEKYSDDFIYKALLPLLTTFSSCKSPILEYSLMFCALSFSMGLLSFFHPTYWRKAKGGISSYLEIIFQQLAGNIYINKKISKVVREKNKVIVHTEDGAIDEFDEVIFATHADITLSLLENPSRLEKEILEKFEYTYVESVLHSDSNVLIPNHKFRSYCEFYSNSSPPGNAKFYGSLTRIINQLPLYNNITKPILVTFDTMKEINHALIYIKKTWKIPKLRPIDMANKRNIKKLQGKNRTWFCGTDTTFTGHEGAVVSGLVIAHMHGAPYPFSDNNWAKIQFNVVKGLMGLYTPSEKLNNFFMHNIYSIAKILGLHKSQISRVLLDLYG